MPVTFLAHQGPLLPITRRWPHRIDGVTLMVGTMSPDFAYVVNGSRFNVWAHGFPSVILFCVPVTLLVSWLLCRPVAQVLPAHLPNWGGFNVHDYRGLAVHRFRWGVAALSAMAGSLSHVLLDSFTHDWGWFAQNIGWYRANIFPGGFFGREVTLYRIIQNVGHIVLSGMALVQLHRYGKQRWMATSAAEVFLLVPTAATKVLLWSPVVCAVAATAVWVYPFDIVAATDILRLSAAAFAGLIVSSHLVLRHKENSCQ